MDPRPRRWPAVLTALTAGLLLAACGDTPEERLERARAKLDESRRQVEEASQEVEAARAQMAEAEGEHAEAVRELRDARQAETAAASRLEARASDVAVFRSLQGALLEAEGLRQAAVSAEVEDGEVTLRGVVPNEAARERALEIARRTPGVSKVNSELEVQ